MENQTKKLHLQIKLRAPSDANLAMDCARFVAQTADAWSAGLTQLHSVFVFTVGELGDGLACEVVAEVPSFPATSKGLSLVGQTWLEDALAQRDQLAQLRIERARKAAAARWGNGGDQ
jgi:hypothetical protein